MIFLTFAIVDPGGVADAVASYTYPKCNKYFKPDNRIVKWEKSKWTRNKWQPKGAFTGGWEGNRPLRICRGINVNDKFPGTLHPGKIYDGKCNFAYGSSRIVVSNYEVLIADKNKVMWVPSSWVSSQKGKRQPEGAIIGGHQKDRPLRICRAQHVNGQHPGKIYGGKCNFAYGSSRVVKSEYEVLIPIPNSVPHGFIKCAKDYGSCRFNGTVRVFYGAGNKWLTKKKTTNFNCDPQSFGGDPSPGKVKTCYIPSKLAPTLPSNYEVCASDKETCNFRGKADVYYGSGRSWKIRTMVSSAACEKTLFGDPNSNALNRCYVPADQVVDNPTTPEPLTPVTLPIVSPSRSMEKRFPYSSPSRNSSINRPPCIPFIAKEGIPNYWKLASSKEIRRGKKCLIKIPFSNKCQQYIYNYERVCVYKN